MQTYKPEVSIQGGKPVLNTDQKGYDSGTYTAADEQPAWERHLKRGLAVAVGLCTAAVPVLSTESPVELLVLKGCAVIIGFGAALGITSRGNQPRRK